MRHQWRERHSDLTLVYLRDLALDDLVARLEAIPPHSIVVFIRQAIRTPSQNLEPAEGLTRVLRASPVPVFSLREDSLGRGVVGGPIWRFETDARRVATMARRIATGTSPRDIPIGRNTYQTMLDWQQLQRWGIAESRIPAGSIVLFRPQSFIESVPVDTWPAAWPCSRRNSC